MDFFTLVQILDATVRLAIPLLLACLAGLFSERAGIFDIGLEGKMLAAAFFSAAIASMTGSVWIGLLAGIAASLFLSGVHGLASITFRGNQLISGVAINFLAAGMTVLIAQSWFSQGGRTPSLSGAERFNPIDFPGALTTTNEVKGRKPLDAGLFGIVIGAFAAGLCRAADSPNDVVVAIPHALWSALARGW